MIGYIYNPEKREIATKIANVIRCNDTTIKGDETAVLGTGEYIITDLVFNEGDTLPENIADRRSEIQTLASE
ncbi:hypothetical protein NBE98_09585 [Clostridium swellfunianum]|uniref:hypothetical protein n=1 Tax=Clostridium swellfunianum TaxID=1367462 RepID=UPI00202DD7DF|nr:hypothetical protein [Clostridium swellfunianum]MCM0648624.1 hypothetical protein [Clostridium swellfunianum]